MVGSGRPTRLETVAQLLDGRGPDAEDFLIRSLVEAAERAVSEGFAPRVRFTQSRANDRWLSFRGHVDTRQPCPRKVLRPRCMVEVGVDLGCELVRSALPHVVPEHDCIVV